LSADGPDLCGEPGHWRDATTWGRAAAGTAGIVGRSWRGSVCRRGGVDAADRAGAMAAVAAGAGVDAAAGAAGRGPRAAHRPAKPCSWRGVGLLDADFDEL